VRLHLASLPAHVRHFEDVFLVPSFGVGPFLFGLLGLEYWLLVHEESVPSFVRVVVERLLDVRELRFGCDQVVCSLESVEEHHVHKEGL